MLGKKHWIVVLAAFTFITYSAGAASLPTLQSLIDSQGTVTIGDKEFGDFGFQSADFSASQITVQTLVLPSGDYGIRFQGGLTAVNGQNLDAAIFYSVTVTDPSKSIIGISQKATMGSLGNAGSIQVDEFAYNSLDQLVAYSSIGRVFTLLDPADPPAEATDLLVVNPGLKKIWIEKDINLIAAQEGSVSVSIITQGFKQTAIPVPAAAGLGLLGLGMLAAGRAAKKLF